MKRVKRAAVAILVVAFILSPSVMWWRIIAGKVDMSAPTGDVYMPSDATTAENAVFGYVVMSVWTLAAAGVAIALARDWLKRRQERVL